MTLTSKSLEIVGKLLDVVGKSLEIVGKTEALKIKEAPPWSVNVSSGVARCLKISPLWGFTGILSSSKGAKSFRIRQHATRISVAFCLLLLPVFFSACGVYSFSGASVEGKSIHFGVLENRARNVVPTLSPSLTDKIRNRILSQTGLAPQNSGITDYDLTGSITAYEITVSGVQNTQEASQNRLTISVEIVFKNRINPKADFTQTFARFADFPPTQSLQAVETRLIDDIGTQLADDIFNKAFVNW